MASISGKPARPGATPTPVPETTPWGITAVNAPTAWATTKGLGIIVCVVDTGIQSTHADLAGSVIGGENFVVIRGGVDPNAWADDNGHGTHVAGTIAALDNEIGVIGVAPEASLFAAKVLDKRGSGYNSDVADGIQSCVDNGAHVISMSLGSSVGSSLIETAVQNAAAAGVILVAASGNDAGAVSFPAAYPEVLAVSAVDSGGLLAYFSNTGPEVDYTAPGVSVYSTYKGDSYATLSGTSMATPHVSGVVALWLASGSLGIVADSLGLTVEEGRRAAECGYHGYELLERFGFKNHPKSAAAIRGGRDEISDPAVTEPERGSSDQDGCPGGILGIPRSKLAGRQGGNPA